MSIFLSFLIFLVVFALPLSAGTMLLSDNFSKKTCRVYRISGRHFRKWR